MRITKYYCDHCHKEIQLDKQGNELGYCDMSIEIYNSPCHDINDVDLCNDCVKALEKTIYSFLERG